MQPKQQKPKTDFRLIKCEIKIGQFPLRKEPTTVQHKINALNPLTHLQSYHDQRTL